MSYSPKPQGTSDDALTASQATRSGTRQLLAHWSRIHPIPYLGPSQHTRRPFYAEALTTDVLAGLSGGEETATLFIPLKFTSTPSKAGTSPLSQSSDSD
jgi:hypothetical protein